MSRGSYRRFLFATIAPLGRLVAVELSEKLGDDVALDREELRAAEITGRARAYQSLVGAGLGPARAVELAGPAD